MLLEKKRLLITGLTPQSIAFAAAEACQELGAEIILTNFGRGVRLTEKVAKRLPEPVDVLEMDINIPEQIDAVRDELASRWGTIDGSCTRSRSPRPTRSAATSSTPSGRAWPRPCRRALLAEAARRRDDAVDGGARGLDRLARLRCRRRMADLRLDGGREGRPRRSRATSRATWARGASASTRCWPGRSRRSPARGSRGSNRSPTAGPQRAPLGWDVHDPAPVGRAVAFLLSDLSDGITGEMTPRRRRLPRDGHRPAVGQERRAAGTAGAPSLNAARRPARSRAGAARG